MTRPVARTSRPKSFPTRETGLPYGFPEATPELPESYGEDLLVLMTQDPETLFAYWEITPGQRALGEQAKRPGEEYREALRLNWHNKDLFAPNFAFLPAALDARRHYLRVPASGRSYQVEIGWISEQGHFISLLGLSNRSDAPESWAATRARLGGRSTPAPLAYSVRVTAPLGSSELGRAERLELEGLPADWSFEGPGSHASSGGLSPKDGDGATEPRG